MLTYDSKYADERANDVIFIIEQCFLTIFFINVKKLCPV